MALRAWALCVAGFLDSNKGSGSRGGNVIPRQPGKADGKGVHTGQRFLQFHLVSILKAGSILDHDGSGCMFACFRIMGDHDNGLSLTVQFFQQIHDFICGCRVQVAGWFICQENRRFIDNCPGYGNPFLFPAGKLVRQPVCLVCQANPASEHHGPFCPAPWLFCR